MVSIGFFFNFPLKIRELLEVQEGTSTIDGSDIGEVRFSTRMNEILLMNLTDTDDIRFKEINEDNESAHWKTLPKGMKWLSLKVPNDTIKIQVKHITTAQEFEIWATRHTGIFKMGSKAAEITGYATESTLGDLLSELEQKVEPSDLSALATQSTLASILSYLDLEPQGTYVKNVAEAGTPVQLDSHTCKVVLIQANKDNTGYIKFGQASASCKHTLAKEESASLPCSNSNQWWIDVTVGGEGIAYTPFN